MFSCRLVGISANLKCQLNCIMNSKRLNNAQIYYHGDTVDQGDSGDHGDSADDANNGDSGDQGDSAEHGGSANDGHHVYIMYRQ